MTTPDNRETLQALVMQYLYGDMDQAERTDFEQRLQSDVTLRAMLDSEQRFDSALPRGFQPQIDAERLQGNRWLLQQNLQRETRTTFSLQGWLRSLSERPLSVAFQGFAMAATFVLGIYVASAPAGSGSGAGEQIASAEQSPLALINNDDYEIYQLKVNSYDPTSGAIDLSFSLASETRVSGNVSDRHITQLMAVALQDDIDSAARIDTINVLQTVNPASDVYEALIYVLKNDQNPGVRYQAVQSLVALAHEEQVKEALRFALSEDVNPGVRLEAFAALSENPDSATLAVFRQQMERDSNEYIRTQARNIVEGTDNATIDL